MLIEVRLTKVAFLLKAVACGEKAKGENAEASDWLSGSWVQNQ